MESLTERPKIMEAPPTEEVRICPLCASGRAKLLFWNFDRLHGLPGKFGIVECETCKLVRLSPRPLKEFLGFYYPEGDYYSHTMLPTFSDKNCESVKEQIRNSVLFRLGYPGDGIRKSVKFFSPLFARLFLNQATYGAGKKFPQFVSNGRALDIGCGSGVFLATLKRHGWSVQGVEISAISAKRAKEALDIDVFVGNLKGAKFESNEFDFISMNHSLEHITDLDETLEEIRRVLSPDGILYIEVPNVESLSRKLSKEFWLHWDSPRHLFAFSPATLKLLLEKHKFSVARLRTIRADFYKWDQFYRREQVDKNSPPDRETLSLAERTKIRFLSSITDIYYRVNRESGDFLCCWAGKD